MQAGKLCAPNRISRVPSREVKGKTVRTRSSASSSGSILRNKVSSATLKLLKQVLWKVAQDRFLANHFDGWRDVAGRHAIMRGILAQFLPPALADLVRAWRIHVRRELQLRSRREGAKASSGLPSKASSAGSLWDTAAQRIKAQSAVENARVDNIVNSWQADWHADELKQSTSSAMGVYLYSSNNALRSKWIQTYEEVRWDQAAAVLIVRAMSRTKRRAYLRREVQGKSVVARDDLRYEWLLEMAKQHHLVLQEEQTRIEEDGAAADEEDEENEKEESEKEIARRKKAEVRATAEVERLRLLVTAKYRELSKSILPRRTLVDVFMPGWLAQATLSSEAELAKLMPVMRDKGGASAAEEEEESLKPQPKEQAHAQRERERRGEEKEEEEEESEDEASRIPGESGAERRERRGWRRGVVAGMTEAERSIMLQLLPQVPAITEAREAQTDPEPARSRCRGGFTPSQFIASLPSVLLTAAPRSLPTPTLFPLPPSECSPGPSGAHAGSYPRRPATAGPSRVSTSAALAVALASEAAASSDHRPERPRTAQHLRQRMENHAMERTKTVSVELPVAAVMADGDESWFSFEDERQREIATATKIETVAARGEVDSEKEDTETQQGMVSEDQPFGMFRGSTSEEETSALANLNSDSRPDSELKMSQQQTAGPAGSLSAVTDRKHDPGPCPREAASEPEHGGRWSSMTAFLHTDSVPQTPFPAIIVDSVPLPGDDSAGTMLGMMTASASHCQHTGQTRVPTRRPLTEASGTSAAQDGEGQQTADEPVTSDQDVASSCDGDASVLVANNSADSVSPSHLQAVAARPVSTPLNITRISSSNQLRTQALELDGMPRHPSQRSDRVDADPDARATAGVTVALARSHATATLEATAQVEVEPKSSTTTPRPRSAALAPRATLQRAPSTPSRAVSSSNAKANANANTRATIEVSPAGKRRRVRPHSAAVAAPSPRAADPSRRMAVRPASASVRVHALRRDIVDGDGAIDGLGGEAAGRRPESIGKGTRPCSARRVVDAGPGRSSKTPASPSSAGPIIFLGRGNPPRFKSLPAVASLHDPTIPQPSFAHDSLIRHTHHQHPRHQQSAHIACPPRNRPPRPTEAEGGATTRQSVDGLESEGLGGEGKRFLGVRRLHTPRSELSTGRPGQSRVSNPNVASTRTHRRVLASDADSVSERIAMQAARKNGNGSASPALGWRRLESAEIWNGRSKSGVQELDSEGTRPGIDGLYRLQSLLSELGEVNAKVSDHVGGSGVRVASKDSEDMCENDAELVGSMQLRIMRAWELIEGEMWQHQRCLRDQIAAPSLESQL